MADARLRLIEGRPSPVVPADPLVFQSDCVEAFVASWTARGFADSTIGNDIGVLDRMLASLGRPAWEVTAEDVDRVAGDLATAGRAVSTRRNYLQVFKGFHRFLEVRKRSRSRPRSGSGWSARWMSTTLPAMSAAIPRLRTRRRRRNGWRSSSAS